ncbi:MAG: hypothetical protein FJ137_05470 [Deltaproteobacteria bacterium]|nr:hypothetical protein [Deltaproteobacteria bacterium]
MRRDRPAVTREHPCCIACCPGFSSSSPSSVAAAPTTSSPCRAGRAACIRVTNDPQNRGVGGITCAADAACVDGACVVTDACEGGRGDGVDT